MHIWMHSAIKPRNQSPLNPSDLLNVQHCILKMASRGPRDNKLSWIGTWILGTQAQAVSLTAFSQFFYPFPKQKLKYEKSEKWPLGMYVEMHLNFFICPL